MGTDSMYRYQPAMLNSLSNNNNNISVVGTTNYASITTPPQWAQHPNASTSCQLYYQAPQQHHWTKYYHTSPKRYYHYRHFAGKNVKDASDGDKKDGDGDGLWAAVEAQAAFLGPNIWDNKNLGACDADLKVGAQYVDLDEFLSENGIPMEQQQQQHQEPNSNTTGGGHVTTPSSPLGAGGGEASSSSTGSLLLSARNGPEHMHTTDTSDTKRERSISPYDPALSPSTIGPPSPTDSTMSLSSTRGRDFDPRTRAFSDEELKPQPMIKKSRKQFVPDDLKDEKYWARRRKNNLAAKRSRDARRVKENQIALRAGFLEKENLTLKQEVERLRKENSTLKNKLDKSMKSN